MYSLKSIRGPTNFRSIGKAILAEAEQNVNQLKAAYDQALANAEKVKVQVTLAEEEYDRQKYLFHKNVVPQAQLDVAMPTSMPRSKPYRGPRRLPKARGSPTSPRSAG